MAKLNKEKFDIGGGHKNYRTTSSGDMELHLYYETEHHYFYFENGDIQKFLGKDAWADFSKCFTRDDAIKVMRWLIDDTSVKTKMLRIEIRMPDNLYKVPNPASTKDNYENKEIINPSLPTYLAEMLEGSFGDGGGLSIRFQRVMKIAHSNGITGVADCDKNWNYD